MADELQPFLGTPEGLEAIYGLVDAITKYGLVLTAMPASFGDTQQPLKASFLASFRPLILRALSKPSAEALPQAQRAAAVRCVSA